jgi:predicted nucleic acid-binding protein
MTPPVDTDLVLIDTNVLAYSLDPANHTKQRLAIDLLDELAVSGRGAVSVQCLTECFNALTRKLAQPIPAVQAAEHVVDFAATFAVLDLTSQSDVRACQAVASAQIALWDALIWSVAWHHRITTILTEDMQHRSTIEGVSYLNPFAEDFDLSRLISSEKPQ